MRVKSEFKLVGAKPVTFKVDDGVYDFTHLYVELPLTDGNGVVTSKYDFADSKYYERHLADIELPVQIMADIEIVSTGKVQKTIIHSIEILNKKPKLVEKP
uniref:Uncharacterized protein n=1 Tax=Dulem virus 60 TaxID=3145771 RepID=A0AAU8B565_9VIRU